MMNRTTLIGTLIAMLVMLLPATAGAYDLVVDGIYYNLVDGHAVVTNSGQTGCYSGDVVIPESVTDGNTYYPVTVIGKNAFMLSNNLTHVSIPHTVTSIESSAFAKCSGLTDIVLPNSLKSIGAYAFTMCGGLTSVVVPESVTTISQYAFYACTALESLTVGESVASIGENAFNACYGLSSLTWNAKRCFSTGSLTTGKINSVTVGDEVEMIPQGFVKSSLIVSIALPNSLTTIGEEAFFDCARLTDIVIPDSVTDIKDYTFYKCTSLTSVTLGNSVKTVGVSAFENCSALTGILIPDAVTTIEDYAFSGCGRLTSIALGSGVARIGRLIFYGCSQLTDVISFAATPPTVDSDGLFDNMDYYAHATLHVQPQSLEAYQSALCWKDFYTILGDVEVNNLIWDVNGDGEINIADLNAVVVIIINGGSSGHGHAPSSNGSDWPNHADVNSDGEVNIADLNSIINKILGK